MRHRRLRVAPNKEQNPKPAERRHRSTTGGGVAAQAFLPLLSTSLVPRARTITVLLRLGLVPISYEQIESAEPAASRSGFSWPQTSSAVVQLLEMAVHCCRRTPPFTPQWLLRFKKAPLAAGYSRRVTRAMTIIEQARFRYSSQVVSTAVKV